MKNIIAAGVMGVSLSLGLGMAAGAGPVARTLPRPLPAHPGNIFLADEDVSLAAPPGDAKTWRLVDYDGKSSGAGHLENGRVEFGRLPVGYYRAIGEGGPGTNFISLGVLQPLRAPTPLDSPIGIDVAMAWCFPRENMASAADFCELAGMNRVRDRAGWPDLEPNPGEFVASNRYDLALQIQDDAGLQVLQVNHIAPNWASPNSNHAPLDLRTVHDFYREMARRWRGKILAFEPWNEGDLKEFGGHTGNELASLQKAAYLGLKAGNPGLIVCDNVFGIHRRTTLRNFNDNRAWAYFDTFNLHHYEPLAAYPKLYADFREISAGKPLWVTECNITVPWAGDEALKEPSPENLRVQSERVIKIYSESIYEGAQAVFFFMLPNYTEGERQYGLLHADLTPRPAFLAAAAAGRLLADARPLGKIKVSDAAVQGFLFQGKPDGKKAHILVIWSDSETEFKLPSSPLACFDHLGREHSLAGDTVKLTQAPLFLEMTSDAGLTLTPPPSPAKLLSGQASPVVLQAALPQADIVLGKSAYKLPAAQTNDIPLVVYNFGDHPVRGKLTVTVPDQWTAQLPGTVEIDPGVRKELTLKLGSAKDWTIAARVQIQGDFGGDGEQTLAVRFAKSE